MSNENETANDEAKTGNVVKNTEFKSTGDWINRILGQFCTVVTGAVEAVEGKDAVLDDDGNEVEAAVPAVRGKKGKETTDLDALKALADANGITYKEYANPGMYRMNIGNMLRAAAKKRGGLFLPSEEEGIGYEFTQADEDFEVNDPLTHNPDGSKIKIEKPVEDEAEGGDEE